MGLTAGMAERSREANPRRVRRLGWGKGSGGGRMWIT